jgi:hypothetical protein
MSDYQRDCTKGLDVLCRWMATGLDWLLYILFFPVSYPLALLGRRERRRIKAENESTYYRDTYGR